MVPAFYKDVQGSRLYRKQRVGTVRELPPCRDAEKAVLNLRSKINSEVRSPETVSELIAHYSKHELTAERKVFSTVEVKGTFLKLYVAPEWGSIKLSESDRLHRKVAFCIANIASYADKNQSSVLLSRLGPVRRLNLAHPWDFGGLIA